MGRPSREELVSRAEGILKDRGFILDRELVPDGQKHYFNTTEKSRGRKASCTLYLGVRPRIRIKWHYLPEPDNWEVVPLCPAGPMTPEEQDAYRAEIVAASNRRKELADAAARKAQAYVLNWCRDATGAEGYLKAKMVPAVPGLLATRHGDVVVVVAHDASGEVRFLQRIYYDSEEGGFVKLFTKDSSTTGCWFEIPAREDGAKDVALVCEGLATGIDAWRATDCAVFVAFDCGNLAPVAEALVASGRFRGDEIIFVADNDWRTASEGKGNAGLQHAVVAARGVGGRYCVPAVDGETFPDGRPVTDANDVAQMHGLDVLGERMADAREPGPEPAPKPKPREEDWGQDYALDMTREPNIDAIPSYVQDPGPEPDAGGRMKDADIEPMPLRRPAPPQESYPAEAFGPLAGAVRILAERCYVHESVAGGVVLGYLSMLAQRVWNVRSRRYSTPLSLFMLMIMSSGDGKSDVERIAGKVVRECEEMLRAKEAEERKQWRIAVRVHSKAMAKADKDFTGGKITEDEYKSVLEDLEARAPQTPLPSALTLSDVNQEGLYKQLRDGRPSIAVFSSEGGKLLGGMAFKDDNKLKFISSCSDLWSGDALDKLRMMEDVSKLPDRRLAMSLMIQPIVAADLFRDELLARQGYLARFLPTAPVIRRRGFVNEDVASLPDMLPYYDACRQLLGLKPPENDEPGQELDLRDMELRGEALDAYAAYLDEVEADLDQTCGPRHYEPVRESAKRSAEQAVRIAGVLTGAWAPYSEEVLPEAMESGIRLARWYLDESLRISISEAEPPKVKAADALMKWLSAKRIDLTSTSQILQYGPGSMRTKESVDEAVQTLVEHGWLKPAGQGMVVMGDRGRMAKAKQTFIVVPGYGLQK